MLDIIMDTYNLAIGSLTENIQILQMKDMPRENVETIVGYLNEALALLSSWNKLLVDMMGLLKDIFCSAKCKDFTAVVSNVYSEHKCRVNVIKYMEYT